VEGNAQKVDDRVLAVNPNFSFEDWLRHKSTEKLQWSTLKK
jgi:hypothetical protein